MRGGSQYEANFTHGRDSVHVGVVGAAKSTISRVRIRVKGWVIYLGGWILGGEPCGDEFFKLIEA
eukprot:1387098-Amorphochlora_amoeboformis.AAC.2